MINVNEKLVYCGKIVELSPIPKADKIELATALCGQGGKWRGVVGKDQFKIGDRVRVFLPDSILPQTKEFTFMEKFNWRVKMTRFKGVPSECVIMPLEYTCLIGADITEAFGVTRYLKPIPAHLNGNAQGDFPSFVPKTDEPNYQSCPELIEKLIDHPYYVTMKLDGSSTTAYKYNGHFGVCSRNFELVENGSNGYWRIAHKYKLAELLPEGYAIQWETCGPGVQSNPMHLPEMDGFAFNVYDIKNKKFLEFYEFLKFTTDISFPKVPLVMFRESFEPFDYQDYASLKYPCGKEAEGIVIRSQEHIDGRIISFKVINLGYKD